MAIEIAQDEGLSLFDIARINASVGWMAFIQSTGMPWAVTGRRPQWDRTSRRS
jgi:hypothetical protein